MSGSTDVRIRPYSEGDLHVLEGTLGDPKVMVHVGGPESAERIQKRHKTFLELSEKPSAGCMFTIVVGSEDNSAGNVGYWETDFGGQKGWETGWFVLPEFQGRGIATAATRLLIERLARLRSHRYLFAFPSVDNDPSNAICSRFGFTLLGDRNFDYRPGTVLQCNIWRLDVLQSEGQLPSQD